MVCHNIIKIKIKEAIMLKATDIMQKDLPRIISETTIEELGRIFIDKDISGLPVVDSDGKLIGVVTEHDLISRNSKIHIPTMLRLFDAFIPLDGFSAFEEEIKRISAKIVGDVCNTEPVTVGPDATLEDLATLMTEKNFHHIPVVDGDKLLGMITQHDLLKGISGEGRS